MISHVHRILLVATAVLGALFAAADSPRAGTQPTACDLRVHVGAGPLDGRYKLACEITVFGGANTLPVATIVDALRPLACACGADTLTVRTRGTQGEGETLRAKQINAHGLCSLPH
jgi:hypothetical protein